MKTSTKTILEHVRSNEKTAMKVEACYDGDSVYMDDCDASIENDHYPDGRYEVYGVNGEEYDSFVVREEDFHVHDMLFKYLGQLDKNETYIFFNEKTGDMIIASTHWKDGDFYNEETEQYEYSEKTCCGIYN